MKEHIVWYNCKGVVANNGGQVVACPELVCLPTPVQGAPGVKAINEGKKEFKGPEFKEHRLTCSRGHSFNYHPLLDEVASSRPSGDFPELPTPKVTEITKEYWLARGFSLVDSAYANLQAQVKSTDTFVLWLQTLVPAAAAGAALALELDEGWEYVAILLPVPLVLLARFFCALAQLPGSRPFHPSSWEDCQRVVDLFTQRIGYWLRWAKAMMLLTVLSVAVSVTYVSYAEVQKRKGADATELVRLRRMASPAWAELVLPGKSKQYQLRGSVPKQPAVWVSLTVDSMKIKVNEKVQSKEGSFILHVDTLRSTPAHKIEFTIVYQDTAGGLSTIRGVGHNER
ncbi:MAG: hypothetical protein JNN32_06895 [Flavobacteriales bacterium]|nr:hypothetical protein [Flavobacteriales bacterium]